MGLGWRMNLASVTSITLMTGVVLTYSSDRNRGGVHRPFMPKVRPLNQRYLRKNPHDLDD